MLSLLRLQRDLRRGRTFLSMESPNASESLASECRRILREFEPEELKARGVWIGRISEFGEGHQIVTFPHKRQAQPIAAEKIFSDAAPSEACLYVHLPFCTGKCTYCSYVITVNSDDSCVEKYLSALKKEIALLAKTPALAGGKIQSVYFGGGTPTYLSAKQLSGLVDFVKQNFKVQKGAEISCEASPETMVGSLGKEKLRALLENGVNRISFGAESFNNAVLQRVNRRHDSKAIVQAYENALEAGFEHVDLDLIQGLPGQTPEEWHNELQEAMRLSPTSVTVYSLRLRESPLYFQFLKNNEILPTEDEAVVMRIITQKFFSEQGYLNKPIHWFVKDEKYLYRHQEFKWGRQGQLLGVGVSSYSFMNGCQYFNTSSLPAYLEALSQNRLPIERGRKLSERERMVRYAVMRLKMVDGVDKKEFENKFGEPAEQAFPETIAKLSWLGLIENTPETLRLSFKGIVFAEESCREFFPRENEVVV